MGKNYKTNIDNYYITIRPYNYYEDISIEITEIKYDIKNYICQKHNEHFIKYCLQCNKNICYSCDDEHEEHNQMYLNDIKININEKKNNLNIMKKEIDIFNNNINEIINKLKDISNIMNIYYEINNNIINNYEKKNRNYQILQNIKQINNNNEI